VRVAHAVTVGYVVRVPDDPEGCAEPLHTAVAELGNALRDLAEDRPLAERAFAVLRASVVALPADGPELRPDQRRLRRRCLRLAQRLDGPGSPGRPGTSAARRATEVDHTAAAA
jgi:hypothetical protein